jgi:hypothetical protein
MPGERKRKATEKNPRRQRGERRQTRRLNKAVQRFMSNLSVSQSKRKHGEAFLAKIVKVTAGSKYDVKAKDGTVYEGVPLAGKMRLKGKLHHNPEVTAARLGSFVFVEGGQIAAVLDDYNAQSARRKIGWQNASVENDLFIRERPASRSRSRSRSGSGSRSRSRSRS